MVESNHSVIPARACFPLPLPRLNKGDTQETVEPLLPSRNNSSRITGTNAVVVGTEIEIVVDRRTVAPGVAAAVGGQTVIGIERVVLVVQIPTPPPPTTALRLHLRPCPRALRSRRSI